MQFMQASSTSYLLNKEAFNDINEENYRVFRRRMMPPYNIFFLHGFFSYGEKPKIVLLQKYDLY